MTGRPGEWFGTYGHTTVAVPLTRRGERCEAHRRGFFCTRTMGHTGRHHATGLAIARATDRREVLAVWGQR